MNRYLLVGTLAFVAAVTAVHGNPEKSYQRTHTLHGLDPRVAETLAWEICSEVGSTEASPCKVITATADNLIVLGTDQAQAAFVKMLAKRDPAVRSAQRFEVVLIAGVEAPRGRGPSDFPSHVATALAGVQELMTEARFEMIGTGWIRTSDRGLIRVPAPDGGAPYLIDIEYRGRRVGLDSTELMLAVKASRDSNNPHLRHLLTTSLSVFVGETVVVASSTTRATNDPVVFLLLTATD